MKFSIRRRVAFDALAPLVPPELRRRLPTSAPGADACYTVVIFHDAQRVVHGRVARKAAGQLGDSEDPLLVIGYDLTAEAYEALRPFGATFITRGDGGWTDASHEHIRVWIASNVKKPDLR